MLSSTPNSPLDGHPFHICHIHSVSFSSSPSPHSPSTAFPSMSSALFIQHHCIRHQALQNLTQYLFHNWCEYILLADTLIIHYTAFKVLQTTFHERSEKILSRTHIVSFMGTPLWKRNVWEHFGYQTWQTQTTARSGRQDATCRDEHITYWENTPSLRRKKKMTGWGEDKPQVGRSWRIQLFWGGRDSSDLFLHTVHCPLMCKGCC